jgi:hypothetical protein
MVTMTNCTIDEAVSELNKMREAIENASLTDEELAKLYKENANKLYELCDRLKEKDATPEQTAMAYDVMRIVMSKGASAFAKSLSEQETKK